MITRNNTLDFNSASGAIDSEQYIDYFHDGCVQPHGRRRKKRGSSRYRRPYGQPVGNHCGGHCRATIARQLRSGVSIHPGIYRLLYARRRRNIPAGNILKKDNRGRRPCCCHRIGSTASRLQDFVASAVVHRPCWHCLCTLRRNWYVDIPTAGAGEQSGAIDYNEVDISTTTHFNLASLVIVLMLAGLYATWW